MNFGNELFEIVLRIYNTRSGRAAIAEAVLKKLAEQELNDIYNTFSLSSNGKEVLLNWIFSDQSINNINKNIKDQLDSANPDNILRQLCFFRRK